MGVNRQVKKREEEN